MAKVEVEEYEVQCTKCDEYFELPTLSTLVMLRENPEISGTCPNCGHEDDFPIVDLRLR